MHASDPPSIHLRRSVRCVPSRVITIVVFSRLNGLGEGRFPSTPISDYPVQIPRPFGPLLGTFSPQTSFEFSRAWDSWLPSQFSRSFSGTSLGFLPILQYPGGYMYPQGYMYPRGWENIVGLWQVWKVPISNVNSKSSWFFDFSILFRFVMWKNEFIYQKLSFWIFGTLKT